MEKKEAKQVSLRIGNINFRRCSDKYEIVKWFPNDQAPLNEHCIVLATFRLSRDESPNLCWCGRRPMDLDADEWREFMQCVRYGYDFIESEIIDDE